MPAKRPREWAVGDEVQGEFNGEWFDAVVHGVEDDGREKVYSIEWLQDESITEGMLQDELRESGGKKKQQPAPQPASKKRPREDEPDEKTPAIPEDTLKAVIDCNREQFKTLRGKARTAKAVEIYRSLSDSERKRYEPPSDDLLDTLSEAIELVRKPISQKLAPDAAKARLFIVQLKALHEMCPELPEYSGGEFKAYEAVLKKRQREAEKLKSTEKPKPAPKPAKQAKTEKKKDEPKKKDAPKKKDPFAVFSTKNRAGIKAEHPDKNPMEVREVLLKMWEELSEEEKKPFVKEAEEEDKKVKDEKPKPEKKVSEKKPEKKKKKPKVSPEEALRAIALHNNLHHLEAALRVGTLETGPDGIALVSTLKAASRKHKIFDKLDFSEPDFIVYHRQALQEETSIFKGGLCLSDVLPVALKPSRSQTVRALDQYLNENSPKIVKSEKISHKEAKKTLTEKYNDLSKEEKGRYEEKAKEKKERRKELEKNIHKFRLLKGEEQGELLQLEKDLKVRLKADDEQDDGKAGDGLLDRFNKVMVGVGVKAYEEETLPREMLGVVTECCQHVVMHDRKQMTTDERNKLKKERGSDKKLAEPILMNLRTEIFNKLYAKPEPSDVKVIEAKTKGLSKKYKTSIMDAFTSAETWDDVLYVIRDSLDQLHGTTIQKRVPISEKIVARITSYGTGRDIEKRPLVVTKMLPHESTMNLPRLPPPTPLNMDSSVRIFFADIVHCWLQIYVFAKAFRITRFPLHQFFEAITSPQATTMLKAVFTQLLCFIESADEADEDLWMSHVLSVIANEHEMEVYDTDDSSASESESESESSESSSESESDDDSVSVSDTGSNTSSSESSDPTSSESESNDDEDEETSAASSDASAHQLTARQIAKREEQKLREKNAKVRAKEDARKAKEKLKQKQAASLRAKKRAKEREREKEKEAKKKAKEKAKEVKKREKLQKAQAREGRGERLAAARAHKEVLEKQEGYYFDSALRHAVEEGRDIQASSLADWGVQLRVLILRGLLRIACLNDSLLPHWKEVEKGAHEARVTMGVKEAQETANLKEEVAELEKDDKEGREETQEDYEHELSRIRYEGMVEVGKADSRLAPLGADRAGKLYFKFPTDVNIYVYTPRAAIPTLAEKCSLDEERTNRVSLVTDDDEEESDTPSWVILNGTWATVEPDTILPLLSDETCHESYLKKHLVRLAPLLEYQKKHVKAKRHAGSTDIKKYLNKFTASGLSYLSDELKADP